MDLPSAPPILPLLAAVLLVAALGANARRRARSGRHAGRGFLGRPDYPRCKTVVPTAS